MKTAYSLPAWFNQVTHSLWVNSPQTRFTPLAGAVALALVTSQGALAAPEGGVIVGGTGSIVQSGLDTTVTQTTQRMAVDWQRFDVAADERVQFQQPNSSTLVLNRVLTNAPSEIYGRIDANGRVLLVNPNGVFFGGSASINVGGLVASGLDIDPNAFMNGDFYFTATQDGAGFVINQGLLQAAIGGEVVLLGKTVENTGLITANLGRVDLAAGAGAVLTFDAQGLIGIQVTADTLENRLGVDSAVLSAGEIEAQGGEILFTARAGRELFSQAVNNTGIVSAAGIEQHGGTIRLVGSGAIANSGTLDTSAGGAGEGGTVRIEGENITQSGVILANAQSADAGRVVLQAADTTLLTETSRTEASAASTGHGGSVRLLGQRVGLFDQAEVTASGANGGGEVLIGGDREGGNPEIRNAQAVYLGAHTAVSADATAAGDGGKLIVFAQDSARVYGGLSARGGAIGGDGGFVETSGRQYVNIVGSPDVSAPGGQAGYWLIDPPDIVITTDASTPLSLPTPDNVWVSDTYSQIHPDDIVTYLSGGGTLEITTQGTSSGAGDITVSSAIDFNETNLDNRDGTLILDALGKITINAAIHDSSETTGGAESVNLKLLSGGEITIADDLVLFDKSLTIEARGDVNQTAGTITAGNLDLTAQDDPVAPTRYYDITLDQPGNSFSGTVIVNNANNVTLDAEGGVELGASTVRGDLHLRAFGVSGGSAAIRQSGELVVAGDLTLYGQNTTPLDVVLLDPDNSIGGALIVLAARDVDLRVSGGLDVSRISAAGHLSLEATGDIQQVQTLSDPLGHSVTVAGTTSLTAGSANAIRLDDETNDFGGLITIVSGRDVTLADRDDMTLSNLDLAGDLSLTTRGGDTAGVGIRQTGEFVVAGDTMLEAAGASGDYYDIVLTDSRNDFDRVAVASARNVSLVDRNAVVLGDGVTGWSLAGDLDVETRDGISQNAPISMLDTKVADLRLTGGTDGAYSIDLDHGANQLYEVGLDSNRGNVRVRDADGLRLSTVDVRNGGNLEMHTVNGISQVAATALTVGGALLLQTSDASIAPDVTVIDVSNSANSLTPVTVNAASGSVSVSSRDAVTLESVNIAAGGFTLTAGGDVSQTGAAIVSGTATMTAAGADVVLTDGANDFGGLQVEVSTLTVNDINDLVIGDLNATTYMADLQVTAGGVISQSAAVSAINASFESTATGALGYTIDLDRPANDFTNLVLRTVSGGARIADTNAIQFSGGDSSVTGNLVFHNPGDVTQANRLRVSGTFSAEYAANGTTPADARTVTLDDMTNDFGRVRLRGATVDMAAASSIEFEALNATGAVTVETDSGDIRQSSGSALVLGGAGTWTAGGSGRVILDNAGNDFVGEVAASGEVVRLQDANSLVLGDVTASGPSAGVEVTADGVITVSAGRSVSARSGSGSGVVSLGSADLSIAGTIDADGHVALSDSSAADTIYVVPSDTTATHYELGLGEISRITTGELRLLSNTVFGTAGGALLDLGSTSIAAVGGDVTVNAGIVTTGDFTTIAAGGAEADTVLLDNVTIDTRRIALSGEVSGGAATLVSRDASGSGYGIDLARVTTSLADPFDSLIAQAQRSILVGELTSATDVTLSSSGGAIHGASIPSSQYHISADTAVLSAATGIGPLRTHINTLDATNLVSGSIVIDDAADLNVRRAVNLSASADAEIELFAGHDIVLLKEVAYSDVSDPAQGGWIYSAGGNVLLTAGDNGTITSIGATSEAYPDIGMAGSGQLLAFDGHQLGRNPGDIGIRYGASTVGIFTDLYWEPAYYPSPIPPEQLITTASLRASLGEVKGVLSAEQQSEIDELVDLDPAIFTALRNYDYDDLAVRLPPDQYEDRHYAEVPVE